jgi:hypothetical protein
VNLVNKDMHTNTIERACKSLKNTAESHEDFYILNYVQLSGLKSRYSKIIVGKFVFFLAIIWIKLSWVYFSAVFNFLTNIVRFIFNAFKFIFGLRNNLNIFNDANLPLILHKYQKFLYLRYKDF